MHTEESLMALADRYGCETALDYNSRKASEAFADLRLAIRKVLAERDERPTKRLWDETATAMETLRVKFHNVNAECERLRKLLLETKKVGHMTPALLKEIDAVIDAALAGEGK